jgi:hypothetical protein
MDMATIVCARFDQQAGAQHAVAALVNAGFGAERISSFYRTGQGRETSTTLADEAVQSPGSSEADNGSEWGAGLGAAVGAGAGVLAMPVLGPAAIVAAAGIGAYAGSLYGALGHMDEEPSPEGKAPAHAPAAAD